MMFLIMEIVFRMFKILLTILPTIFIDMQSRFTKYEFNAVDFLLNAPATQEINEAIDICN